MSRPNKEEKEEYEKFCEFTDKLTDDEIKELAKVSHDYEVITPDSWFDSCFHNIPDVFIFLFLTITPNVNSPSERSPSFVANLTYNLKNQTFEHRIINPFDKEWNESRNIYWSNYRFILPLGGVVEIYSKKCGKGRKKSRYYVVTDRIENGIKPISKRKAHKLAVVRANIVGILGC